MYILYFSLLLVIGVNVNVLFNLCVYIIYLVQQNVAE